MSNAIQTSLGAIFLLGIVVLVIGCVSEASPASPQMSTTSESASTEDSTPTKSRAPTKDSIPTQANQPERNHPEPSSSPAPPASETGGVIKVVRDIVSPLAGDTLGDFLPAILDDQVNSQRNLIIIAVGVALAILCAVLVSGILV